MGKFIKTGHTIAVIIFSLLLVLPMLFFNFEEGKISQTENKVLASFPDLSQFSGFFDSKLPTALDGYISDNIGFKQEGTLSHICLMYGLFRQLAVSDYIEGKEDNFYYSNQPLLSSYQGLTNYSEQEINTIYDSLVSLNDAVNNKGAKFVFMPIPNKEDVYNEYLPDGINIVAQRSNLSTLKDKLIIESSVATVDTLGSLLNAKQYVDGMLYYKNIDPTHWNMNGMFVGYKALMQTINKTDNSITYLTDSDVNITGTVENKALAFLQVFKSINKLFKTKEDVMYKVEVIGGFSGVSDNTTPSAYSLSNDTTNRYFHYYNENAKNNKVLFVVGDSYIWDFMLPMLSETFSDVYFLQISTSRDDIEELLGYIKPDFVVLEIVYRMTDATNMGLLSNKLCQCFDSSKE